MFEPAGTGPMTAEALRADVPEGHHDDTGEGAPTWRLGGSAIRGVWEWREEPQRARQGCPCRYVRLARVSAVLAVLLTLASSFIPPQAGSAGTTPRRPNIVFILTDDLSWNLINPRSHRTSSQLERQGETFTNYFVADSLCCPSRVDDLHRTVSSRHQGA